MIRAFAIVFLALATVATSPAIAAGPDGWSGEWQTFWRTGQAVMNLEQEGSSVTGTYEPGGGQIEGEIEGPILKGIWSQAGSQGGFLFALSNDGMTFTGRYENGEYWNGERAAEGVADRAHFTASFSPRETLRTVITAANAAVFQRDAAAARFYEPLLIYEGDEENARERNRRRQLLFQIMNLSTFRIIDAPERVDGDQATFEIGPVDSTERYALQFRMGDDSVWRIVLEPEEKLAGVLRAFQESLGASTQAEVLALRRHNPRHTMRSFMHGMRNWDRGGDEEALDTLDLSYLPLHLRPIEGPIVADYLRQVIDRIGYVIWQEIPNDPDMTVPYIHYSHPHGDIMIVRQAGAEGEQARWMFAASTLQQVPSLFSAVQNIPISKGLGTPEPVTQFFQLREAIRGISPALLNRSVLFENWQWGALVVAVIVSLLAGWLAALALTAVLAIGRNSENEMARTDTGNKLRWPLRISVAALALMLLLANLGLLHSGLGYSARIVGLIAVIAVTILVFQLIGTVGGYFFRRAEKTPSYIDEIVVSLTAGLLKLLTVVLGIFAAADIVGLPYEGVITGLGIGGIALAFAARDTVSNMLGGAILMADRPFKRGDMIATEGELALIENVGLRSTRLRTLDDSLLIIPNAQLSDKAITNWGKRRKRRVILQIGLTYDTPRSKLDKFVERLKAVYSELPRADTSNFTVGLMQFGPSSIDIELRGYFHVYGYEAQVAAQHELLGNIIDLAEKLGVSFAFPTRTVHLVHEEEAAQLERLQSPSTPQQTTEEQGARNKG
jgi:small-conductance mechanosensitive channel